MHCASRRGSLIGPPTPESLSAACTRRIIPASAVSSARYRRNWWRLRSRCWPSDLICACHAQWREGYYFFFADRPCVMSALPPKADIDGRRLHRHLYSVTSSAATRSVWGTVKPSAFAVLRLIMRSNLVGCSTGRSLGFAPLRILATYMPARRVRSGMSAP